MDKKIITFTPGEYTRLAQIVGSLAIKQFDDQEPYREAIYEIFSTYRSPLPRRLSFDDDGVAKEG